MASSRDRADRVSRPSGLIHLRDCWDACRCSFPVVCARVGRGGALGAAPVRGLELGRMLLLALALQRALGLGAGDPGLGRGRDAPAVGDLGAMEAALVGGAVGDDAEGKAGAQRAEGVRLVLVALAALCAAQHGAELALEHFLELARLVAHGGVRGRELERELAQLQPGLADGGRGRARFAAPGGAALAVPAAVGRRALP